MTCTSLFSDAAWPGLKIEVQTYYIVSQSVAGLGIMRHLTAGCLIGVMLASALTEQSFGQTKNDGAEAVSPPNSTAALAISQAEMEAFGQKVSKCWRGPITKSKEIYVYILVKLNRDGTLSDQPIVTSGAKDPTKETLFQSLVASAIMALKNCQPYTMFNPDNYESWKELEPRFVPYYEPQTRQ
ncbi:hypothetical protein ABLE91_20065 [Aquabacter sp. CN5-332]|uniref:hypothetical protein n=1 Tax=Aquabacter sp. CN5-332 TaxID=3156608 RepID=UPI0032B49800